MLVIIHNDTNKPAAVVGAREPLLQSYTSEGSKYNDIIIICISIILLLLLLIIILNNDQ